MINMFDDMTLGKLLHAMCRQCRTPNIISNLLNLILRLEIISLLSLVLVVRGHIGEMTVLLKMLSASVAIERVTLINFVSVNLNQTLLI